MTTTPLSHGNALGKLRRHHRNARRIRWPSLPALRPGARPEVGWNGKFTFKLPTEGGGSVTYSATPIQSWRFKLIDCDSGLGAVRSRVIDAATIECGLQALIELESQYLAAQRAPVPALVAE
jgi:hypothetical protein